MVKKLLTVLFGIYFIVSVLIFAPLYNWRYARDNGFFKWLLLGEIVATAKSFVWPYYTFFYSSGNKDNPVVMFGELNDGEIGTLRYIGRKSMLTPLSEDDYSKFRVICKSYQEKIGNKRYVEIMTAYFIIMDLGIKHQNELNKSLNQSIQENKTIVTDGLRECALEAAKLHYTKIKLENDIKIIDDAVKGKYFIDTDGATYNPISRKQLELLNYMVESAKSNSEGMKKVFLDTSKQ